MPNEPKQKGYEAQGLVVVPADTWRNTNEHVTQLYLSGLTNAQISEATGIPDKVVRVVIRKLQLRELAKEQAAELNQEILKDKGPILSEVTSLALLPLREWLLEIQDPEIRKKRVSSVQDAKVLQSIATDVANQLRLELGKPTEISASIQLKFEDVRALLLETQKKDPVGLFKAIDDGKKANE